jgi:hypothetical protein
MLYCQRVGELHWRRADGPLLGRLHPGAFVSVVPGERGSVRVGSLPFERSLESLVVYVDREVLGSAPRTPTPVKPSYPARAVRLPGLTGWIDDPETNRWEPVWRTIDCADVWIWPEGRTIGQYVKGVEVIGLDDNPSAWSWNTGPVYYESLRCPARAVARSGERLQLYEPDKPGLPTDVDRIPEGYERFEMGEGDPLGAAIEHRGSLYWLLQTEKGTECDERTIESRKRATEDRVSRIERHLVRRKLFEGKRASFPLVYTPARAPTGLKPAKIMQRLARRDEWFRG